MNRKRNVSYIKPEDPEFLKRIKKQAGYDDKNHKFDELNNADGDFVDDDVNEQPQVVVLKEGDLTAEEAEVEMNKIEKLESEKKADLSQRVIFNSNQKNNLQRHKDKSKTKLSGTKKKQNLLSFGDDDDEE